MVVAKVYAVVGAGVGKIGAADGVCVDVVVGGVVKGVLPFAGFYELDVGFCVVADNWRTVGNEFAQLCVSCWEGGRFGCHLAADAVQPGEGFGFVVLYRLDEAVPLFTDDSVSYFYEAGSAHACGFCCHCLKVDGNECLYLFHGGMVFCD